MYFIMQSSRSLKEAFDFVFVAPACYMGGSTNKKY